MVNAVHSPLKDMVVWMEDQLKAQKREVLSARQDVSSFGVFSDCGDSYRERLQYEEGKLAGMVRFKQATEKYIKKLQHEKCGESE